MIRKVVLLAALFFSPLCIGGQTNGTGTITQILVVNSGVVFVTLSVAQIGAPACATLNRWVINGATPAGKAMVAAMYTAYATNSHVSVLGTGTCDTWADTESILYFVVSP
jgi:hypothetical protein